MKKNWLLLLLLTFITHSLFAFGNEDSLVGSYAYSVFRGELPQGTCDVGKKITISRIQLDLNKDKTVTKSFTENHNQNPLDFFPANNKNYNIKGQWVVKNDTLFISLQKRKEAYLITAIGLIELVKLKDGNFMQGDSSKSYRGECRIFKRVA